ncbi:MAG: NUDIX hydrolase [Candidatus Woesebacteria bacterium]|jgi:8-oxo-dGTP pyrophosphatase MutT (NUDIX family)
MKIIRPPIKQKMPASAERVFKGVIYDVYHWQQKLYDGKFKTFEKLKKAHDGVNIIPVTQDKKIIVTYQEQPGYKAFYGLPGGVIDPGEAPLAAAERELLEETGHQAQRFLLWDAIQPYSKIDWAVYTFIAKGCERVADLNLDGGEKIELKFFAFEQFLKLMGDKSFRDSEVALKILRMRDDEEAMKKLKKIFLE